MRVDRRGWHSLALAGGWIASCGLVFWLVYLVTVRTSSGRLFADASLRGAVLSRSRVGNVVDQSLGVVTVASLLAAVALIAVIALVRLRRGLGLAAVGLLVVSNVSAQLLKSYVLQRPDLGLRESAPATLNSLPGGHSAAAFSVVVALLLVVPARTRGVVATAGGFYACVVALATMAAGWHRTADSVAAFLLVGIWVGVVVAVMVAFDAADRPGDPAAAAVRLPSSSIMAAAALALGLAVALMAALAVATPIRESTFGEATAFATGGLFIVGTAIVVLAGVLVLVERIAPRTSTVAASDPQLD